MQEKNLAICQKINITYFFSYLIYVKLFCKSFISTSEHKIEMINSILPVHRPDSWMPVLPWDSVSCSQGRPAVTSPPPAVYVEPPVDAQVKPPHHANAAMKI